MMRFHLRACEVPKGLTRRSGLCRKGVAAGPGGGPRRGWGRLNSCEGVCPKWLIWSSTACMQALLGGSIDMHAMLSRRLFACPARTGAMESMAGSLPKVADLVSTACMHAVEW